VSVSISGLNSQGFIMRNLHRYRASARLLGAIGFLCFGSLSAHAQTTLPVTVPPPPPLVFAPCTDSPTRDCAILTVPLNYADLSQGNIGIPVVRVRATGNSIGALFFMPGGPGLVDTGSFEFDSLSDIASNQLLSRFDFVTLAPRGTTTGAPCLTTNADANQYFEVTDHLPKTTAGITALIAEEQHVINGCVANNQPLINYVNTASVVRDIEQLRRAMNLATFSFMGQSYGTFVGYRYAKLYPGHLRAAVLDGVEDHSISSEQNFQETVVAYDLLWQNFKYWCQQPVNNCSLIGHDIDADFDQVLATARATPIPAPLSRSTQRPVNDWDMTIAMQAMFALGNVLFSTVDEVIHQGLAGDASFAREVYDNATGATGNGTYSLGFDAHRAIYCTDETWSQSLHTAADLQALISQTTAIAPRFGAAGVAQVPATCVNYPVAPVETPPLNTTVTGQPPMLLVAGSFDADTPITGAIRMASHLQGSSLLIRNGYGHLSYAKSTCVQQTVDNYLINLTLPASGTVCSTDMWPVAPPQSP
jgi:pimeloyl-ACP methyl ester carboxylesterase